MPEGSAGECKMREVAKPWPLSDDGIFCYDPTHVPDAGRAAIVSGRGLRLLNVESV